MESGDTSDEDTPPHDPKRKDPMQKEQSKVISMLVAIETKDGLRRCAIIVIAKNWLGTCRPKSTCELGKIDSSECFLCKKF